MQRVHAARVVNKCEKVRGHAIAHTRVRTHTHTYTRSLSFSLDILSIYLSEDFHLPSALAYIAER